MLFGRNANSVVLVAESTNAPTSTRKEVLLREADAVGVGKAEVE